MSKLGLVLGGGGVRCLSHLGVYQALVDHGIQPDLITSSSTGTLIGILLAAGITPLQIREYMDSAPFRWGWIRPTFRSGGLFTQRNFQRILNHFEIPERLENLNIPLRVVTTDLVRARPLIFDRGNTRKLTLASCALPGIYAPVRYKGTVLGDGGVTNNVPADICRKALGPRGIIVCSSLEMDTSMPPEEIRTFAQVVYRSIYLPIVNERYRNIREHSDILIEPFADCPLCFSQWREILRFHNRGAMEHHFQEGYQRMTLALPKLTALISSRQAASEDMKRAEIYEDKTE